MKHIKILSRLCVYIIILTICVMMGCRPDSSTADLGAKPKADFAFVQGANGNSMILVNKTTTPSVPYWTVISSGQKLSGDSAKVSFIFAGTYNVQMVVTGHGGLDSITKSVTISQNDANACNGTAIGFLTGCGTKTWKLNPAAAAYEVGPSAPDDGSWWSNGSGDVASRVCEFNDTYTFTFNAAGTFVYDNKGDFYADGYMGTNGNDCENNAQFTTVQKPWGSGNFQYVIVPGAGVNKLGQLQVVGLGAHIGLQKVTNGGELPGGPVSAITYDIISMKHDPGGFDLLKLAVYMPSNYWWTFTLRSY